MLIVCWCALAPAARRRRSAARPTTPSSRGAEKARLRPGYGDSQRPSPRSRRAVAAGNTGSVALWALGRCAATGTFADSLKAAGNFSYCRGRKEGFALGGLSAAALRACVGKARRRGKAA